MSNKGSESNK